MKSEERAALIEAAAAFMERTGQNIAQLVPQSEQPDVCREIAAHIRTLAAVVPEEPRR